MKKLLLLLVLAVGMIMISCENVQDVRTELQTLQLSRDIVKENLRGEKEMLNQMNITSKEYSKQIEALRIERDMIREGKEPQYILKLKLKQSHFSIDPMKHIKDGMNAIEFELPVSKDFYNKVSVGTNIVDDFRMGSFILNGSFGDWNMTVEEKIIK